jgi:hypothetical protein
MDQAEDRVATLPFMITDQTSAGFEPGLPDGSERSDTKEHPVPSGNIALMTAVSGGGGIRTHGDLATTTVFETVRFVHSRTPPSALL